MDNNHIVLVVGKPSTGKSSSLRNIPADKTAYINFDGKPLPFDVPFAMNVRLTNIDHLLVGLDKIEQNDNIEYIVFDTITYMMDMFENQKVIKSTNTQKAWGEYAQFYLSFMQKIKASKKKIIVFGHTKDVYNENELVMEQRVPVKGSIGARGVEADFTVILGSKKVKTSMLEDYKNSLLNITEHEDEDGFKYVFQTRVTKDTMNEKMRSPICLWDRGELYIDNDIALVMNRISEYYK